MSAVLPSDKHTGGVLILAGGTGGHVFPALAVAKHLHAHGVPILWLGTQRGLEARVVPAAGFEIEWVRIEGLRRQRFISWISLPLRLLIATWQAWRVIRRRKPQVTLAMGGFVSGPGGIAAWLTGTPLIVHEQNAVAGMTNRWLANIATRVLCGFPNAFGDRPGTQHVGNPVRKEIINLPLPKQRYSEHSGACRVLVIGGSQGAQVFNRVLPQAIAQLPPEARPEVWHQAGRTQHEQTQQDYDRAGVPARATAFIDDMAAAYAWADVVICRAGAMTLAELCAAGVAAILVPYPHATDDHQTANAQFIADRQAALFIPEIAFSVAHIGELLRGFAQARSGLLAMAERARSLAMPDATEQAARHCLEAMHA